MARRGKWKLSKDLGLALGHVAGRYFAGLEELHFGYWPEDLPVELANLSKAQAAFSDLILEQLPAEAESVVEVGCGTGVLAERVLDSGRSVDVVSPSSYLTRVARDRLGERVHFHECRFEELETERRYDLVLFSESFQYIEPGVGLELAASLLKPGGRILICDFFKLEVEERSPIGGGREYGPFQKELKESGLATLVEIDITDRVAPGLAVLEDLDRNLAKPGYEAIVSTLAHEHPRLLRLLRWWFKRKLEKFEKRIAAGARNEESFRRHKTYRLYLLAPS